MRPGQRLEIEAAPGEREKFVLLAGRRGAFVLCEEPLGDDAILLTLCKEAP